MATSMTVAKLAVPTFVGLKAGEVAKPSSSSSRAVVQQPSARLVCVSSLEKAGKLMLGASAGVLLAASTAFAAEYKINMGTPDGNLVFSPSEISTGVGDTVTFTNVAGFPHNVIFDEYESLSHEDLLNAPGESFTITMPDKGTYEFYCDPHQGVGMKGKITVS